MSLIIWTPSCDRHPTLWWSSPTTVPPDTWCVHERLTDRGLLVNPEALVHFGAPVHLPGHGCTILFDLVLPFTL